MFIIPPPSQLGCSCTMHSSSLLLQQYVIIIAILVCSFYRNKNKWDKSDKNGYYRVTDAMHVLCSYRLIWKQSYSQPLDAGHQWTNVYWSVGRELRELAINCCSHTSNISNEFGSQWKEFNWKEKFQDPKILLLLANIEFIKWMSHYFEFCICAIEYRVVACRYLEKVYVYLILFLLTL